MKHGWISIQTIIEDYIDSSGHEGELDEVLILKFANDAIERISSDEQLAHKIALLDVKNYQAQLPPDFKYVIQAAYRAHPTEKCTREQISQITQKVLGTDCELEININCHKCKEESCSCSTPIVEVDVNRIWETAHPELYAKHMKHYYSHSNTVDRPCHMLSDQWVLMQYKSNHLHNIQFHIPHCLNTTLDNEVAYEINKPNMTVNFEKGQVLLSYMGLITDSDGYRMIPDEPIAFRAINDYIEERLAFRAYRMSRQQNDRIFWQQMLEVKERSIARAREQLQIPDYDEFWAYVKQHWLKTRPDWEHEANLNRRRKQPHRRYPTSITNPTKDSHRIDN